MVEEIARPEYLSVLPIWVISCAIVTMYGLIILLVYDRLVLGIGLLVFALILFSSLWIFVIWPMEDWRESVFEQIDSFPCKDLKDAYEIYEMEYIKERYVKECVDDWEWWK